jgi:predicted HAD superfamily Cof-like phosphohydrolase
VDACGDAIIFAIGGMARMGLTPLDIDRVLHAIMDANFEKKAGVKPGREGAPDAVKPEGWVGPEERIKVILNV